jgi:ABC-type branched-subunit amino acid transport system ATPase component
MSDRHATADPVLAFDRLTVRFGGLTAVCDFSYDVAAGEIDSIIGPNGAGKTTAFNAATGIYAPTSGRVLLAGREPQRPFTWRVTLSCVVLGLLTGLAMFLLAQDIDRMWQVAIKRNMGDPTRTFSYATALRDAVRYLRGDLVVTWGGGRKGWVIESAGGQFELDRVAVPTRRDALERKQVQQASRQEAEAILRGWQQVTSAGAADSLLVEKDGKWQIVTPQGAAVGKPRISREAAQRDLREARQLVAAARRRNLAATVFGLIGLTLGAAGTYSVWQQSRRTPDVIARSGIARTFQNIRLFREMTVLENVLVGMDRRLSTGLVPMMLRTPGVRRAEEKATARSAELLKWMGLSTQQNLLAKNLPYGAQRRLEIARALATRPQVLLLDEPAAGMNPNEAHELMGLIRQIKEQGITVLLIEHHMKVVMNISDRIAVLDQGRKIAEGTPKQVRDNRKVIEAYLGQEEIG